MGRGRGPLSARCKRSGRNPIALGTTHRDHPAANSDEGPWAEHNFRQLASRRPRRVGPDRSFVDDPGGTRTTSVIGRVCGESLTLPSRPPGGAGHGLTQRLGNSNHRRQGVP